MADWKCPRCGAINLEDQRACEGCGRETEVPKLAGSLLRAVLPGLPRGMHVVRSAPLPAHRPDTTAEQNKAAVEIVRAVSAGEYDAAEGRKRLAAIFQMPELERVHE